LGIGESITVKPFRYEVDTIFEEKYVMDCTLLEIVTGDDALKIAKQERVWSPYDPLVEGQEYLALRLRLKLQIAKNENVVETLYPYWSTTLRYENNGVDIWSADFTKIFAEGYPPIEGENWVIFKYKSGTKPFLYFSPYLAVSEQVGIRNTGAYFKLFE
jgi:hypothetical protein